MSALHKWIIAALFIALWLFSACKDANKNATADTAANNPLFQQDAVLKAITEEIAKNPADASLYFERGRALQKMKEDTLALHDYMQASKLDSTKAEYFSAVGNLLFEAKDINGSLEWIQKAIKLNPEDRKARLKIAKLFLYLKDYPQAFSEINIVLRKNVYDPEAYFLKGMIYCDAKDTAKAISSFLTALQVAPDYKEAAIELGLLYNARHDSLGMKYLDNAYAMDTTDVFPIYARGTYFQEHKDYERAKEEYIRCIVRDRKYTDAYFNMGYILMQQDSMQKAWRQYDMAIKSDPGNPSAYFNRGLCSELMDSLDAAMKDYSMSYRLDTSYEAPKKAIARLLHNQKKN